MCGRNIARRSAPFPALLRRDGRALSQGERIPASALLDYATPPAPLLDYSGAFLLGY